MRIQQAINSVIDYARQYHQNLENKNLMFIFKSDSLTDTLECTFKSKHFLHLTGVEFVRGKFKNSEDFYNNALDGKISPENVYQARDKERHVEMKMEALSQTMSIHQTAREIGDFVSTGGNLFTQKLGLCSKIIVLRNLFQRTRYL